jgi:hypothetical protein
MAIMPSVSRYLGDTVVTGNTQMITNTFYVASTNSGIVFALPAAASLGDIVSVFSSHDAFSWTITQAAGQVIHINGITSFTGTGHQLTAPSGNYSCVTLICTSVGGQAWGVQSAYPASVLSAATSTAFGYS